MEHTTRERWALPREPWPERECPRFSRREYSSAVANSTGNRCSLPDEDVLTIAREEERILIVADRDFGELIFQQHIPADLVVRRFRAAPIASRRQDLQVEHPV